MSGIFFSNRQVIVINSNTVQVLIYDTKRQKVESSNDIVVNANNY